MPKRLRESGSSKKGICSILRSSINWDIWHKHQVRTPKVRTTPMSSDPVHTSPHPYGRGSNHERILVALLRKMFSLARDWASISVRIRPHAFSSFERILAIGGLRALAPMPTIVRSDFVAIATKTHAAPTTRVVLGRVIKKEHACGVLTFLDQ